MTLQPQAHDAVLGGQTPAPIGAAVLGGMAGVQQRIASQAIAARIAALREAQNYGEHGLNLIIQSLNDPVRQVQHTALSLLWRRPELHIQQVLAQYSPYQLFDIVDTLQGHREAIASLC